MTQDRATSPQLALEHHNAVLGAVNRILGAALSPMSEAELGRVCLHVAEALTGAGFSLMGEVDPATGRLGHVLAGDRGWPGYPDGVPAGSEPGGVCERIVQSGESTIADGPAPLRSFLGVPLKQGGRVTGVVALGRREGVFRAEDRAAVEALGPAILQALTGKRMTEALRRNDGRHAFLLKLSDGLRLLRDDAGVRRAASSLLASHLGIARVSCFDLREEAASAHSGDAADAGAAAVFGGLLPRGAWDNELVVADDVTEDTRFSAAERGQLSRAGIAAFIAVAPLRGGRRPAALVAHHAQARSWTQAEVLLVYTAAERVQEAVNRARAEKGQRTLQAELRHRVRNMLAVVRSVVSQSESGERSAEEYVQHLQGRIAALAAAQGRLTRATERGVDLEELLRDELLMQAAPENRLTMEGPDVDLPAKAADVMALAVHELATNATKYGAFSREAGRLDVRWCVEDRGGQGWLVFHWVESGVPVVEEAPRRSGFGTEMISRRVPYELKGDASFALRPGGLHSRIEFPLLARDGALEAGEADASDYFPAELPAWTNSGSGKWR